MVICGAGAGWGDLGDAEVKDLDAFAANGLWIGRIDDIVGLEISVDNTALVGHGQRGCDLPACA